MTQGPVKYTMACQPCNTLVTSYIVFNHMEDFSESWVNLRFRDGLSSCNISSCPIWRSIYFYFSSYSDSSFSPVSLLILYERTGLINLVNEVHSSGFLQGFALMKSTGCTGLVEQGSRRDWCSSYVVYAL